MGQCSKVAHDPLEGIDDNEALDYVARLTCPETVSADPQWPSAARERLATLVLKGARAGARIEANHLLASIRLAEALMGTGWVNAATHGWLKS